MGGKDSLGQLTTSGAGAAFVTPNAWAFALLLLLPDPDPCDSTSLLLLLPLLAALPERDASGFLGLLPPSRLTALTCPG
jgi:hypothetical protein